MTTTMQDFAEEWIAAWNSLDLERILGHYAAEVVFTSPRAAARLPHTRGTVRGLDGLRAYWGPVATVRPELRFTLEAVLETVSGCTILYRDETGRQVAETMLMDADGKVIQGIVSHGPAPTQPKEG